MDKYKKFDDTLDIFPDVSIEPIESLDGAESEEEEIETTPQIRKEEDDIFSKSWKKQKKIIEQQPIISEEVESVIINDEPDKMETIEPKRRGRGKAIKKYNAKPRTEKQLAVLEKARLARAKKREEKNNINVKIIQNKNEIIQNQHKIEEKKTKPIEIATPSMKVEEKPIIPKNINDFETFCEYMNKYNTNRRQMGIAKEESHPNKLVKKNLLPRPPLIANEKNKVEKIKKKVAVMGKPQNIYDPLYAINMLSNRGNSRSRFKDPFSR